MPELSKKQRKALVILSVTGGVYISFKYLLPLILPFAAAYLTALVLRPSCLLYTSRVKKTDTEDRKITEKQQKKECGKAERKELWRRKKFYI